MSNNKTKYQLLLERLIGDPELKKKALETTPEQFLALCREKGLEKLSLEEATQLQKTVKSVFNGASEPVSLQNLANVAGGIDCAWGCGPLQCC